MGKKKTILFKLLSSAGTGKFYLGSKATVNAIKKLTVRKYDPIINRHVIFNETKLPSGKKRWSIILH